MRLKHTILIWGLLLGMAACRGSGLERADSLVSVDMLHGTSAAALSIVQSSGTITLYADAVDSRGLFLSLTPPAGQTLHLSGTNQNDNLLFLQVTSNGAIELGAVAIDDSRDCSLSVSFTFGNIEPARETRLFEDPYRVDELVVVPSGQEDIVTLNWVEKNIGDYDFNGEVNIADIVPLSANFGASGFRDSTAANTTALYYIDGDENNEINIADLVPIARNYKHTIRGYFIYKNGILVSDPETEEAMFYSRDSANDYILNDAPVFYQVSVEGSFEDQYALLPVNASGEAQSQSVVFDGAELQSRLTLDPALEDSNIGLFDLSGNGKILYPSESGGTDSGLYCVMRVIEPIDIVNGLNDPITWFIPDNWESVPASVDAGIREGEHGYRFEKLERPAANNGYPLPYQLEILVAPNVDLLTGETRSYPGSNVPNSFYYRLAVPVYIPAGHRTVQADLSLDFTPSGNGPGYDVILRSHQYQTGLEFDNSVIRLALQQDSETGECTGLVSRVFDPDPEHRYIGSDFLYSPQFHDSNYDGISDQLQLRLITLADTSYYNRDPYLLTLRGTPMSYNAAQGSMPCVDIYRIFDGGLKVFYAGQRTLLLSELTRLTWIIHDHDGDTEVQLDPQFLTGLGDNAEVQVEVSLLDGSLLNSNGLSPLYWVDSQTVTLDLTNVN